MEGNEHRIIEKTDVLTEYYIPENLYGRTNQIEELILCFNHVITGKPINAWIYGPPGAGKTATARFALKEIERALKIQWVYVNCWLKNTLYSTLEALIDELKILGAQKPDTRFKLEQLRKFLKHTSLIVILDEIDKLRTRELESILYNLCLMETVGLLCIADSRLSFFNLDERIKSRLNINFIEFKPYTKSELVKILESRAREALALKVWDKKLLEGIAEKANGDARVAIQALKKAAYYAEKENSPKITISHIEKGWIDAKAFRRTYILNTLTEDHRIFYEIIKVKRGILSNELWDEYILETKKRNIQPIVKRTFPVYANKLRDLGLISVERAKIKGRVRVFRAVK